MRNKQTITKENKTNRDYKLKLVEKLTEIKGVFETWQTSNLLTAGMKNKVKKDLISLKELKTWLNSRIELKCNKSLTADLEEFNAIVEASKSIQKKIEISISVEYKSSRTWGSNPSAIIELRHNNQYERLTSGSITGCGYDKESTAIAVALNQSLLIQGLLYKHRAKLAKIYGHSQFYQLSGGVGTSCFIEIFETIGFKSSINTSGKMSNYYNFSRG